VRKASGTRLARPLAALGCALAGIALTACGAGGASPTRDPAHAVPAQAALYVLVNLHLRGEAQDETDAALRGLFGANPGDALVRLAAAVAGGEAGATGFARDVRPWLGARAGLFVIETPHGPARALVLATTDTHAAQRTLASLHVPAYGTAAGFVVAGETAAVNAARRLDDGGVALAETDAYQRAGGRGGRRRVALVYVDPVGGLSLLPRGVLSARALRRARDALALAGASPAVAAVAASPDAVTIDLGPRPVTAPVQEPSDEVRGPLTGGLGLTAAALRDGDTVPASARVACRSALGTGFVQLAVVGLRARALTRAAARVAAAGAPARPYARALPALRPLGRFFRCAALGTDGDHLRLALAIRAPARARAGAQ
jgi:hypothetical protein